MLYIWIIECLFLRQASVIQMNESADALLQSSNARVAKKIETKLRELNSKWVLETKLRELNSKWVLETKIWAQLQVSIRDQAMGSTPSEYSRPSSGSSNPSEYSGYIVSYRIHSLMDIENSAVRMCGTCGPCVAAPRVGLCMCLVKSCVALQDILRAARTRVYRSNFIFNIYISILWCEFFLKNFDEKYIRQQALVSHTFFQFSRCLFYLII